MTRLEPTDAQPMKHNPNAPHRNPNLIHPGHDSHEIDQRPVPQPARRTSSLWAWVFLGVVALILFVSILLLGGTGEVADGATGGIPAGGSPIDAN